MIIQYVKALPPGAHLFICVPTCDGGEERETPQNPPHPLDLANRRRATGETRARGGGSGGGDQDPILTGALLLVRSSSSSSSSSSPSSSWLIGLMVGWFAFPPNLVESGCVPSNLTQSDGRSPARWMPPARPLGYARFSRKQPSPLRLLRCSTRRDESRLSASRLV